MNPHTRMAAALAFSLVIWAPVAFSVINGGTDAATGALYYLAALAFAWVGTGLVMRITEGYRAAADRVELTKRQIQMLERRAATEQNRRRDDRPQAEDHSAGGEGLPPTV